MPGEKEQETSDAERAGLLIIGHGTRSRLGQSEFRDSVQRVRSLMPGTSVRAGFLEGGEPTIESGWQQILATGVKKVVVSPLLLFAAGHAKDDIPHILGRLAKQSPAVQIRNVAPLGCDPALVQLSVKRYRQAAHGVDSSDPRANPTTLLLFIGRGARDSSAISEARRYARLVANAAKPDQLSTCFLTMAKPSLDEGVSTAVTSPFERVVVVPHLLFAGQLLRRVRKIVAEQDKGGRGNNG